MDYGWIPIALGYLVVSSPFVLLAAVGLPSLVQKPLEERTVARITELLVVLGLLAAIGVLAWMLLTDARRVPILLGDWVHLGEGDSHFQFRLLFVFDRLSVPFVILTFLLCGTIGAFAAKYMHREPGYHRFFVLFAVFLLGMVLATLAGTIETLFAGWELVGLSSALLVAFFHDRVSPVANGLHVWSVYRVADAAFLVAAVYLHHLTGHGEFDRLMGTAPWPEGTAALSSGQALFIGLLLVVAAAGKSALVPFSGWLPRAMEGPTPSSAVFYGALSVHLGAFLLLRVSPVLEQSYLLCAGIVVLGAVTAVFATIAGRVQTDMKSALAFASLTQVGVIVVEIGCGLRYIALIHILGHACMRTLQLLRAPSLLRDYSTLENAVGGRLAGQAGWWYGRLSTEWQQRLFRMALDRGYLDAVLQEYLVLPLLRMFRQCDRWERQWTDFLSGRSPPRESSAATREDRT